MSKIVLLTYSVSMFMSKNHMHYLGWLINKVINRLLFGCQIGIGAKIGKDCILGYGGLGVVIHHRSEIGSHVNIGTNVTIGGALKKMGAPIIGDNTIISTGAKIIGPIRIGANCVVGANAVVLEDVPDNSVAVGVPARVIKSNIDLIAYR